MTAHPLHCNRQDVLLNGLAYTYTYRSTKQKLTEQRIEERELTREYITSSGHLISASTGTGIK